MTHRLSLLGPARLHTSQGSLPLERKTAAVLAYLALEGPVHKYRLAGWLWPGSGETAARNNMRQLLRRLRLAAGEVVLGEDRLELAPEAEVDVKRLSYLETPSLELLTQEAELLGELSYDDCPDFEEWLEGARAELRQLRAHAARDEAARLEASGNPKQALAYAQVWARIEPLSEEAHRQVIRLHYLVGDRGAALAAFEQCKRVLRDELGAEPLPETLELVRLVERGTELPGAAPRPRAAVLPAAVLRPPVLAGREREWAMMEEAWEEGKFIFLVGEPGVGKSRLATDFLASKGRFVHLETRPGDAKIPYSTNNRFVRIMLAQYPDYSPPEWVRQTLAPWLPELGEGPPASDPGLQTRYFEAVGHVFDQIGAHGEAAFVDDLQFMDDISAQTGEFLLSRLFPLNQPGGLRGFVTCYRKGEISPLIEQMHAEMVTWGMAVRVELDPLPPAAVGELLQGLGLPDP
ncbi:BTAD domain-containing putative transcriptional regulator, partial [Calidithermus terrae]|uniref:BTAD domain-containing putative transcriptional regulator n=1 Tax=Calidithermus terrae TaxID=1408545 RepID=UPI000E6528F5